MTPGLLVHVALAAALAACSPRGDNTMQQDGVSKTSDEARRFWTAVRAVAQPIGEGGHGYYPYQLRGEIQDQVRTLSHPLDVYRELLATERDPMWREVLVFLIAMTPDPRADAMLIEALDAPGLRPRALYLLGVIGTKGWPSRPRDVPAIRAAVERFLDDHTPYVDIYERKLTFETADFARAAYIRLVGLDRFPEIKDLAGLPDDPPGRFIGMSLPTFTSADRARLDKAIARLRASNAP